MNIYGLVDPRSGLLRYVGKAVDIRRRLASHLASDERNRKAQWIRSLLKLGLKPEMVGLETVEGDGNDAERFWIASLRAAGAILLNMADGGEGGATTLGRRLTADHLAKLSAAKVGRPKSPEHRAKIAATMSGRSKTEEAKARMSAAAHQRLNTAVGRAQLDAARARSFQ